MGKVAISFRILPVDVNVKLESIKQAMRKNLPKDASIHKFEEEPVAFGLSALIAHVVIPEDIVGGVEEVEKAVRESEGVSQVDVLLMRRV